MPTFVIPSMSCGGCASRIVQAVKKLDTNAKIEVDLATKSVQVDSAEDRATLAAALAEAGYPPSDPPPAAR